MYRLAAAFCGIIMGSVMPHLRESSPRALTGRCGILKPEEASWRSISNIKLLNSYGSSGMLLLMLLPLGCAPYGIQSQIPIRSETETDGAGSFGKGAKTVPFLSSKPCSVNSKYFRHIANWGVTAFLQRIIFYYGEPIVLVQKPQFRLYACIKFYEVSVALNLTITRSATAHTNVPGIPQTYLVY